MTNDAITTFIGRHQAAWNHRDPSALASGHAEDGIVISPMFGRVEGRDKIRGTYAALFATFPDWQIQFDPPMVDGSRVAASFSVTATHQGDFMGLAGTGRPCAFEGVSLFHFGTVLLIREERRVYDFTGLLVQLAVLRVRPAR
jgi:steroid delta-isomerase-like uncharacterized protein